MYEHDLYVDWVPLLKVYINFSNILSLKESKLVKQISKYRKIIYMRAHMPWPIWDRDIVSLVNAFIHEISAFMDMELICWKRILF